MCRQSNDTYTYNYLSNGARIFHQYGFNVARTHAFTQTIHSPHTHTRIFFAISFQIIIYSCTKTGRPETAATAHAASSSSSASSSAAARVEILDDQRRLTVAITRAKHKLIVIGDAKTLECHVPFHCLLRSMSSMNKMNLVDGQQGFGWSFVMQKLSDVLLPNNNMSQSQ